MSLPYRRTTGRTPWFLSPTPLHVSASARQPLDNAAITRCAGRRSLAHCTAATAVRVACAVPPRAAVSRRDDGLLPCHPCTQRAERSVSQPASHSTRRRSLASTALLGDGLTHSPRTLLLCRVLLDWSAARLYCHGRSALALTADVIEQNSANYTAWAYRRRCLLALHSSLHDELSFAETIAFSTPKNYQLWHHRRAVVDILGQPGKEMEHTVRIQHHRNATHCSPTRANMAQSRRRSTFIERVLCWPSVSQEAILALDAKNYHVWSYRSVRHCERGRRRRMRCASM